LAALRIFEQVAAQILQKCLYFSFFISQRAIPENFGEFS
jgi:hypothetical protein